MIIGYFRVWCLRNLLVGYVILVPGILVLVFVVRLFVNLEFYVCWLTCFGLGWV